MLMNLHIFAISIATFCTSTGKAKASGKTANSDKPQVPQTEVEM